MTYPFFLESPLLLVFLAIAILFLLQALYLTFFDPLRRVPGPLLARLTSWWITFHARRLHKSATVQSLHNQYGRVVRIAPNHVSFGDPQAYKQIYSSRPSFLKGPFYDGFHQGRPTLFSARDSQFHGLKRKYLNPGFQPRALHAYEERLKDDVRDLKKAFLDRTEGGKRPILDFNLWSKYFSFDVISNYSLGQSFGFVRSGGDMIDLTDLLDKRGEAMNAFGTVPTWAKPLMKHIFWDSFWYDGLNAKSGVQKFGLEALEKRKKNYDPENPDLLSILFGAKIPDTDMPLPEADIVADAIAVLIGGSDAPSITLTHFMDVLSRDERLQKRLQDEVDAYFPGKLESDWVAPDTVVNDLPLLAAALKESMRLVPSSSTGLERVVPSGGREICGYFLPAGTLVSVPTTVIMHDAEVFERPNDFILERWLGDGAEKANEYFFPFGVGPRSCIGRNFAWMEMMMCLATLLKLFNFQRTTKGPTQLREAFTLKPAECNVVLSRRVEVK